MTERDMLSHTLSLIAPGPRPCLLASTSCLRCCPSSVVANAQLNFQGDDRSPRKLLLSAAISASYGAAVHALKSASDTVGIFLTNATIVQISWSDTPIEPKLGMPVILIPFLTTQNSCGGCLAFAAALRSGCLGGVLPESWPLS